MRGVAKLGKGAGENSGRVASRAQLKRARTSDSLIVLQPKAKTKRA
jgi:hypothetical protein